MSDQVEGSAQHTSPFWPQWFQMMYLLIALFLSPLYLYLMSLYGVGDGLMMLFMALFLSFVTYYIFYLLLGFMFLASGAYWLISRYSNHVQRMKTILWWLLALIWGIGILGFAFELIPYNSSTRTYF